MTALAGYWAFGAADEPRSRCSRMLTAQAVYAAAAPSDWSSGDIALGRRLFATLPEDRYDHGPVTGGGGRWTLVADVRLDNRPELCEALGIERSRAAMLSDAAVVMAAVERWEGEAIGRLAGDFALALWDRERRRLLLARDYIGQRPLHYHRAGSFFAFASMAKGLHALPEVPLAPDCRTAAAFIALMPENGSETFFAGVEKVCAGHVVTVTRDGVHAERWWHPPEHELRLNSSEDYAAALREHFDRAVADRLRGAEDGVACHLSAGLDSSSVTATAARLLAPSGGRLTAYTAVPREGFEAGPGGDTIPDEGPYAASLAAMYPNIDHVLVPNDRSPLASLDRYFMLHERPVLNLCNSAWADKIKDLARARQHRILLTGGLGNMSISYDGMPLLAELAARGSLLRLARESWSLVHNGTRLGTVAAQTLGPFLPAPLWRAISRLRGRGRQLTDYTAINPDAVEAYRLTGLARERGLDLSYRPRRHALDARVAVIRRVDPGNYNKGSLAGWGLDVRDPTADRRVMEFCLAIPLEQFLRGGQRRALVRAAFADRLPRMILEQTRKGYQAPDWHEGLAAARPEIAEELERIGASAPACIALDVDMMRGLAGDWPTGGWTRRATVDKYRLALLRGISAGHFLRKAAGSNR